MTITSVGFQTNSLQAVRAQNAFQKSMRVSAEKIPQGFDKEDVVVSISSKNLNENVSVKNNEINSSKENSYISEIKRFASQNNITDFENEDIQDALKYGTSLFVDQII